MSDKKQTKQVELQSGTFEYAHVSPFKLNAVAQTERARYIKDELDDVEPKPPTYSITHGGGKIPGGKELPTWEQEYDYTVEYIAELRTELDALRDEHDERNQHVEVPPAIQARFVDLHNALDAWDEYVETVSKLGRAMQYKKRNAGFWLMFGKDMPEDDKWLKEQAVIGIDTSEVSGDPQERFVYWLETEFVSTEAEYLELVAIVEGRDREMQEARLVARSIFQHPLG